MYVVEREKMIFLFYVINEERGREEIEICMLGREKSGMSDNLVKK